MLSQPASRKRTLESADGPTICVEGPAQKKQAPDTSIAKSQSASNAPSLPMNKIPLHPNSGVSKASPPDKNEKLSRLMKLHLSKTELRMQMTAAKNPNSQTPSSQPSTQNSVQNPQTQATKTDASTQSTNTPIVQSPSSVKPAVSPSSAIKPVFPPASTVKTSTTAKRTGFPSAVNKPRSLSASSQSSAKTSPPAVTKAVSAQPSAPVSAAPIEPKQTVPQSSSATGQPFQNSQNSAANSKSNTPIAKQTPAPDRNTPIPLPPTQASQTKSGVNGVQPATGTGAKSIAGQTEQSASNTPIPTSTVSKETTPSTAAKPPATTTSGSSTTSNTALQSTPSAVPNPSASASQPTTVNGIQKPVDNQPESSAISNNGKALAEQNVATPKPSNEPGNSGAIKNLLLPTTNGTATKQSEPSSSHSKNPATSTAQTSQSEQPTGPCTSPKTGQKIRIRLSPGSTLKKDTQKTQPLALSTSLDGVTTSKNNSSNTTPTTTHQTVAGDTSPALSDSSSVSSRFETDVNSCNGGHTNMVISISFISTCSNLFSAPPEEFLAHDNAFLAEFLKGREQRFLEYISPLQKENAILRRCLKEETARCDELQARCTQAEVINRSLEIETAGLNQQCQQTLSQLKKEKELREELELKLSTVELNAETKSAEAERRLADALQNHARELEQAKKENEENEKRLREELEVCNRERERVVAVFRTVTTIANASS